jgi:hypothetical protein
MNEERKRRKSISNDESREKVDHMTNKVIVAGAMLLQVMGYGYIFLSLFFSLIDSTRSNLNTW